MAWHQGLVGQLGQRALKEEKIHVILRQAAHLQIDISKVMNADFRDSKCYLMQFLCVVLFVCVVVALKEPSYGHGGFMQMGRQTPFHKVWALSPCMDQMLRCESSSFLRGWASPHGSH